MKFLDAMMAVLVSVSTGPSDPKNLLELREINPQTLCLAQNIYHEARNESTAGMVAVANVTINRMRDPSFPNTICEVVFEGPHYTSKKSGKIYPYKNRCQFSWYCDGLSDKVKNTRKFNQIFTLSDYVIKNPDLDITDGALFYHADYVNPGWAGRMNKVAQIDAHIFYKPKK